VSSNTRSGGSMPSGDPPPGAPPISHRARSNAPGGTRAAVPKESGDHPSGDNRFKMLDASMKRHRHAQDALIEVLHTAQELFGYHPTPINQLLPHSTPPQFKFWGWMRAKTLVVGREAAYHQATDQRLR
jgi:hypothetical protein